MSSGSRSVWPRAACRGWRGRMWAWLMICDPPEQTAADIATHLRASRGSISGTARLLETAGLISRITKPGDRREWFRVPPSGMVGMMASQQPVITAYRQLMDDGLELLRDRPASAGDRLRETRRLYAFFEREYPRSSTASWRARRTRSPAPRPARRRRSSEMRHTRQHTGPPMTSRRRRHQQEDRPA